MLLLALGGRGQPRVPPRSIRLLCSLAGGHCRLQTVALELLILQVCVQHKHNASLFELKNGNWGEMEAPWDINVMTFWGLGIKGQKSINTKLLFEKIKEDNGANSLP